jgi:isopenicillin N synthase-like dioxygenase
VLLDDMLERWTNGLFKATGHRVRTTDEQRFSVVMFIAANDDIEIEPLPQFITSGASPAYSAITQGKHIDNEIARAKSNLAPGPSSELNATKASPHLFDVVREAVS